MVETPPPGANPLELDDVPFEDDESAELACEYCRQPITDTHFAVNGGTCCEPCHRQME